MRSLSFRLATIALLCGVPALAQQPRLDTIPVASVDFYGLHTVPDSTVRRAFRLPIGVPLPDSTVLDAAMARVDSIPGVRHARLDVVCCGPQGGLQVYVGVEENGAPTLRFNQPPTGSVRLPAAVTAAGHEFERAFADAVDHKDFIESDTAGYSLFHWPAARAVQLRFVTLAARYGPELRDVLQHSSDATQRALAAQVLGYGADKAKVVADLAPALHDPDGAVRNNAARVLWIISTYAQHHPQLDIHVPYESLVAMLDSPVWTDRNKSSFVLAQMTVSRDPTLLAILRERALPALTEMAQWSDFSHAQPALEILGRLAGMSEDAIAKALSQGDRKTILSRQPGVAR